MPYTPKISRPRAAQEIMRLLRQGSPASGMTTEEIARRLRYALSTVRSALLDLPWSLVEPVEAREGVVRWRLRDPDVPKASQEMHEPDRHARRWERRSLRLKASQWIEEGIALARTALQAGDFAGVHRLVAERGLAPGKVAAAVPPSARARLRIGAWCLRADLRLQAGDTHQVIADTARAIPMAMVHDPGQAIRLLAIRGAALRMLGGKALASSVRELEQAALLAETMHAGQSNETKGWIAASKVAPLLALDDLQAAFRHAVIACDCTGDAPSLMAEALMAHARVLHVARRFDAATDRLHLARSLSELPRWAQGWLLRHQLDAIAARAHSGTVEDNWGAVFSAAWMATEGYGFQRLLLLARLAERPSTNRPSLDSLVERQVAWSVARLHRERHGRVPFECATCAVFGLPGRARHALGLSNSQDFHHYR